MDLWPFHFQARSGGTLSDDLTDASLIEASWSDPELFAGIFARHYASVFAFVTWAVGPWHGAELASEVFTRAFAIRKRYDLAYSSARPWLFGIAANLIRGHVRHRRRELIAFGRLGARDRDKAEFELEALERIEAESESAYLQAALRALRKEEALAVLLFAVENLSYTEIAQALEIPEGTVKSRLSRAREKLRNSLGNYGEFDTE